MRLKRALQKHWKRYGKLLIKSRANASSQKNLNNDQATKQQKAELA